MRTYEEIGSSPKCLVLVNTLDAFSFKPVSAFSAGQHVAISAGPKLLDYDQTKDTNFVFITNRFLTSKAKSCR